MQCVHCSAYFENIREYTLFLDQLKLPNPTLCHFCRQQRRLSFRNERNLYNRTCDLCKQHMIALYSQESPYTVYCAPCWWGDAWDPTKYGRDFDFNKSFTEQFGSLMRDVPRLGMINKNCENSDYSLFSGNLKNCYLVFSAIESEDCLFGHQCNRSRDCVDTSFCYNSELCYEIVDSDHCYHSLFLQNCTNCTNTLLSYNCSALRDCFGCMNLVNKQYCINNIQYSREEYEKWIADIEWTPENIKKLREEFEEFKLKFPHRALTMVNCENSSGDYLRDCKNCLYSFDQARSEDCIFMWTSIEAYNCVDCSYTAKQNGVSPEWCFDCLSAFPGYRQSYTTYCWESHNISYSDHCFNSSDCFGSVGLKRQQYCIFNKPLSSDAYREMCDRVIEHMKKTKEYGLFFSPILSPFSYNQTVAQEFFPLTKEHALSTGFLWNDEVPMVYGDPNNELLTCISCCRQFRTIKQERVFYKKMNLPIPHFCPACRHIMRMAQRNPRIVREVHCAACQQTVQTTHIQKSGKIIYCEACYQHLVYA